MDHFLGLSLGSIDQKHSKFITSQAGNDIGIATNMLNTICESDQGTITLIMPVGVIDRLEVIKVEIEK